jgi:hypothetical protein
MAINDINIRVFEDVTGVEVPASDLALTCLAQHMADTDNEPQAIIYRQTDYVIVKESQKGRVPGTVGMIIYPTTRRG